MTTLQVRQTLRIEKCLNCGGADLREFHGCRPFGIAVHYDICRYCGLIFQNPTCTPEEWEAFYAQDYRQVYHGSESPSAEARDLQERRASLISGFLRPHLRRRDSHLDIGCSMGVLLEKMSMDAGIRDLYGVEPGNAYRKHCQERGIRCHATLDEILGLDRRFSLITMSHVLEHINEPIAYLQRVSQRLLGEDGLMYVEVPNIRGGFGFELAHPICFSPTTLRDTLHAAGLEVVFEKAHGGTKYPSPHATGYLSVIARRSAKSSPPAKAGRWYLGTMALMFWKGWAMEPWPKFLLLLPFRRWKHGRLPGISLSEPASPGNLP